MATANVVLVTGANRGIGLAIVQALAQHDATSSIIVAARSLQNAKDAVASLQAEAAGSNFTPLQLDVADDASIAAAAAAVKEQFGKLDVLVNNAGIAEMPGVDDLPAHRQAYARVFDINISSVANVTLAFLPLLRAAEQTRGPPRVVNISSGRASLARAIDPKSMPTASISYSVSKVALNALTIEFAKAHSGILFYAANPGYCATAFNGFRGTRDPREGARVVVELVRGRPAEQHEQGGGDLEPYEWGFYEAEGAQGAATRMPW